MEDEIREEERLEMPDSPVKDETVYEDSDETQYVEREVSLEVVEGFSTGQVYEIAKPRTTFGRETDDHKPDITLSDETESIHKRFSRTHAELVMTDEAVTLIGHYMKPGGVLVNGRALNEGDQVELKDGDRIRMFSMVFKATIVREPELLPVSPVLVASKAATIWKSLLAAAAVVLLCSGGYAGFLKVTSRVPNLFFSSAWTVRTRGGVTSSPSIDFVNGDNVLDVVVGSEDYMVYALDGRSGGQIWTNHFETDGAVVSSAALGVVTQDGVTDVVIGSSDNKVYCIDGQTGNAIWVNSNIGGPVLSSPAMADLNGDGILDVAVGSSDGNVYALRGETGGIMWRFKTDGKVLSSPTIVDLENDGALEVICGSSDFKLHVIRGSDGQKLWAVTTKERVISSAAVADLNRDYVKDIVFVSNDFTVYAVNGRTGVNLATFELPGWMIPPTRVTDSVRASSPALGDLNYDGVPDVVVGGYNNIVVALDGKDISRKIWEFPTDSFVLSSPGLADINKDGVVDAVIGCDDGTLYILDGTNGRKISSVYLGAAISASPAIADLTSDGNLDIVIASEDGAITAITTTSPCRARSISWGGFLRDAQHTGLANSGLELQMFVSLIVAASALLVLIVSGSGLALCRRAIARSSVG